MVGLRLSPAAGAALLVLGEGWPLQLWLGLCACNDGTATGKPILTLERSAASTCATSWSSCRPPTPRAMGSARMRGSWSPFCSCSINFPLSVRTVAEPRGRAPLRSGGRCDKPGGGHEGWDSTSLCRACGATRCQGLLWRTEGGKGVAKDGERARQERYRSQNQIPSRLLHLCRLRAERQKDRLLLVARCGAQGRSRSELCRCTA